MVAVSDFEISERERMIRCAMSHRWVEDAVQFAKARGVPDPVIVLISIDAINDWPFRLGGNPRDRKRERMQRRAGCRPFTVLVARYEDLLQANGADGWQEDMAQMRRKGGLSVVAINRQGQFLGSAR